MKKLMKFALIACSFSFISFNGFGGEDRDVIGFTPQQLLIVGGLSGVIFGGYSLYKYLRRPSMYPFEKFEGDLEDLALKEGTLWLVRKKDQEKLKELLKNLPQVNYIAAQKKVQ